MPPPAAVRGATPADFPQIAALDLSYRSSRTLVIERFGDAPELTLRFGWRAHDPVTLVYGEYPVERLARAAKRTDAFLVAETAGVISGLLMIVVPPWPYATGAAEITDLAVGRAQRRSGAGRALLDAAIAWARERGVRALWVEPRTDNDGAISFYLGAGFRIAGFNDRLNSNEDDADGRTTLLMYVDVVHG
jgi:ribosomal protein S18 acetylase RimI-like enzyme